MTDEPEVPLEILLDAVAVEAVVEPAPEPVVELEPEGEPILTVLDEVAVVGEGGSPVLLTLAPPGAVAAEQRFNERTGRVEHFTASGELIP